MKAESLKVQGGARVVQVVQHGAGWCAAPPQIKTGLSLLKSLFYEF
jgi:hypothetical protein